jgi:hypothetical protein
MKKVTAVLVAAVMLLGLVSTVVAAPPDPGSGSTNFTVQNLGDTEVTVTADYVNPTGQVDAQVSKEIGSLASDGFPAAASGLDDGWIGSVVVSADQEIVAFAQMIWVGGTAGNTVGAYNGFTEGASKLYLPSLASRDPQYSTISVQSAEAPAVGETVAFTIEFYDREGALSHTINDTVVKGAQVSYSLSPEEMEAELGENWLGSAVIQSVDGSSKLAAVATTHWNQYSAAYSAVTSGGTRISLPSATRRKPVGPWLQYTGVVVQNLDADNAADVTVYWYDRDGNLLHEFDAQIPANSAHGYNTRFVDPSQIPTSDEDFDAAIGPNWNGSVVIESDGAEIVAVSNLQWTDDHPSRAAASAYTSESSGYETVYVPANFRRVDADWIQFTGLIVQNVGDAPCNDFSVSWVARDTGAEVMSFESSLDPNIAAGYNTRVGADIPADVEYASLLGDNFRGAVTINAPGCELVAIHNTVWPVQTDSSTYNAFGK